MEETILLKLKFELSEVEAKILARYRSENDFVKLSK